ncbi:hypothetical protein [Actinomadura rudentiformis]|uniref:DUF748 domain-containing protein n=1 Tax=Actinomadura rudentiformis TaxID=359158 RepID=A0A6H9YFG5_9ACTN|nr:hypothetical protein [Actinomadura rudentiformis]KAB2344770.1 hypothetical protein F8566_29650 [Actinomadura rudentiformis]
MNTATKLGAFALGLAAVFGGAVGVGEIVGPVGATAETGGPDGGQSNGQAGGHAAHGGDTKSTSTETETETAAVPFPGGLQISQDGYTLAPQTTTIKPGEQTDFRFTVNGPDGKPVSRFETLHGKKIHFILARRDLSGFQHLHPTEAGGGVWSVPVKVPKAGAYRFFTDVQPTGAKKQLTLGADLTAPGDYTPTVLPKVEQTAKVDGYEVKLAGTLVPGKTSKLTLSVSKAGQPISDLQPYLEAYGHLVALRAGDLAYLHVHPDGEPGDGKTKPGPDITFYAEVPSSGAYRLYLDFQHAGKVRTAEFTAVAGTAPEAQAPAPSQAPSQAPGDQGGGHNDDGHTHG